MSRLLPKKIQKNEMSKQKRLKLKKEGYFSVQGFFIETKLMATTNPYKRLLLKCSMKCQCKNDYSCKKRVSFSVQDEIINAIVLF